MWKAQTASRELQHDALQGRQGTILPYGHLDQSDVDADAAALMAACLTVIKLRRTLQGHLYNKRKGVGPPVLPIFCPFECAPATPAQPDVELDQALMLHYWSRCWSSPRAGCPRVQTARWDARGTVSGSRTPLADISYLPAYSYWLAFAASSRGPRGGDS